MKLKSATLALALALTTSVVVTGGVVTPTVAATKTKAIALTAEQKASIKKLNAYINSFQSIRAEILQISPRNNQARGTLMIQKPGKLRMEYEAPNPLLLVSDGTWFSITNTKRDRGNQYPINATPLRLVVAENIDLFAETEILAFEQTDGLTSVALKDRKSKVGGYIILVFDETNNVLQQWIVVDGKGQRTTVQLSNLETGVKFDKKLFVSKITRKN